MFLDETLTCAVLLLLLVLKGVSAQSDNIPTVTLSYGTFQGSTDGSVTEFLGMPFAQPPIGSLRFQPAQTPFQLSGTQTATAYGAACPQQTSIPILPVLNISIPIDPGAAISEDCLFVNVIKPNSITEGILLPVVFWIFGGGFLGGDTSANPGNTVVAQSIENGDPVIYASANYRLNAFGFLASQEVKDAGLGNIGLRDQQFALEWVNEYITASGGDPTKVIIWGQSPGSISVGLQLLLNNGDPEGLFRGAFMESGSPNCFNSDITDGQPSYDQLVTDTGCTGAADTLSCLRDVPFETLQAAINTMTSLINYRNFNLTWHPRIDGLTLTLSPKESILNGFYAKIPFVIGDVDDEGTMFSISTLNITTDEQFLYYVNTNYLNGEASNATLAAIAEAYPEDPTQGSPFDTGLLNAIGPQFKRLAAFQGDLFFQAPRRFFLAIASQTQRTYSYLWKRDNLLPILGSAHGYDLGEFYAADPSLGELDDTVGVNALLNFVINLDPNVGTALPLEWPLWNSSSAAPPLLTFTDLLGVLITADTYRADALVLLDALIT